MKKKSVVENTEILDHVYKYPVLYLPDNSFISI